jgi:hypothetical protein
VCRHLRGTRLDGEPDFADLICALGTDAEPDLAGFKHTDKDAHNKVDVLSGGVAGRRRKVHAMAAEEVVQSAFIAHHQPSQWTMKERNHQAQQQSCKFHNHHLLTVSLAGLGDNRYKNLVKGLNHGVKGDLRC